MTGTHTRVHVTDYMWLIAAYLWTNSTSAGFTWSCVCLIVLTFQYTACLLQRLSPCPLWGRHVETVTELLLVYCLKKTVQRFMARDGSLITSVCVTKSCLHVSLPVFLKAKPRLWKEASHRFSVTHPALFVLEILDVFLRWILLPPEPISREVKGHRYISSAKGHISYSETAATSIWRLLHRSIFWRAFKLHFWICQLQSWPRFYSTVWEMSTMTISSKCLGSSTFEWDGSYCLQKFTANVVGDHMHRIYFYCIVVTLRQHVQVKNPYLDTMEEDILYHFSLSTKTHNLPQMFGDIKVRRMQHFTH